MNSITLVSIKSSLNFKFIAEGAGGGGSTKNKHHKSKPVHKAAATPKVSLDKDSTGNGSKGSKAGSKPPLKTVPSNAGTGRAGAAGAAAAGEKDKPVNGVDTKK